MYIFILRCKDTVFQSDTKIFSVFFKKFIYFLLLNLNDTLFKRVLYRDNF
jgi:hypothetical protein